MPGEKTVVQTPPAHPLLVAGLLAIPMSMFWWPAMFVAGMCLASWVAFIERPRLWALHKENVAGGLIQASIPQGHLTIHAPTFSVLQHGVPQIRQPITVLYPQSGQVRRYVCVTPSNGPTRCFLQPSRRMYA